MENKLDGNAAGGILQEIFPFEMTQAQAICDGCGMLNTLGAVAVYVHGMGMILRCPGCNHVLLRVAQIKGRYWLDMRGIGVLQLGAEA